MLQFICERNERYSFEELAQMAVEGGCRWVQLRFPDGVSDDFVRDTSREIIDLCRESSVFLTFENLVDAAKDMSVHGVYLSEGGLAKAIECRELLGPEAIIGVELTTAVDIEGAQNADIDYVALPAGMSLEACRELIALVRRSGLIIPVVAIDRATLQNVGELLEAGFNGVAVGRAIAESANPERATEEFLSLLSSK